MAFRLFRKKEPADYVDLGNLQKRGIIQGETEDSININDNVTGSSEDTGSNLGFLGNLAGASSTESSSSETSSGYYGSSYGSSEIGELTRKINSVIERLELIERKIERIEGKLGLGVSRYYD